MYIVHYSKKMENLNFVVSLLHLLASPIYAIENGWHELLIIKHNRVCFKLLYLVFMYVELGTYYNIMYTIIFFCSYYITLNNEYLLYSISNFSIIQVYNFIKYNPPPPPHCDLPRLHLFHTTCRVDSTLGSPDWMVRLNANTLHR